ncbi:alpha/beta hydrolase [Sanguibacter sp. A247]|uniref:alpha/beta hydrolase n=1 Tax=unclassified Sanguibacter TaxID=2645534 RepID=UPI003FD8431E
MRWVPDVLGDGYEQATIDVTGDERGPVVATLVRYVPRGPLAPPRVRAVLLVHGYNDYVFQTHVAEAFDAAGWDVYGIDLRAAGRSLRPWQLPHFVTDLRLYTEELTRAAAYIRATHDVLAVHAHSTGGLTAALWAHSLRRKIVVDALVLNSPWFDLDAPWFDRTVGTHILDTVAPWDPERVVHASPSGYAFDLLRANGGEWDFNPAWKSPDGVPVRAGWMRAVRRGHARLARGLDVRAPVCVATSTVSGPGGDRVLDVEQIANRAHLVGRNVSLERFEGGAHDLTLSPEPVRNAYLRHILAWLETQPQPRPHPAAPRLP